MDLPSPGAPVHPVLSARMRLGLFFAIVGALLCIRLSSPSDLADGYHQERAAAYVIDAVENGNWICQHGADGQITSKPPLYTWLAGLATLVIGRPTWAGLVFPSALAMLITAAVLWRLGRNFGAWAGFLAALIFLVSPAGAKQISLARIDPLFSCTVALTAMAGWKAVRDPKYWIVFWLAAALSTLAKGPLGLVLAGGAVLPLILFTGWPGRAGALRHHIIGLALFLGLTGGWFVLAYLQWGDLLVDKMIGRELVGHVVHGRDGGMPFQEFYKPPLDVLGRFAPWSLFAAAGLWRVFRRPAAAATERALERFAAGWLLTGLVIFSAAAHQRPDHIFPLLPAAALLAARELGLLLQYLRPRAATIAIGGTALAALTAIFWYYHHARRERPAVLLTASYRDLAHQMRQTVGTAFPLIHIDTHYAFQFFLNTMRPSVPYPEAVELLLDKPAAYVAVEKTNQLVRLFTRISGQAPNVVRQWPEEKPVCFIVSNQRDLVWTDSMATVVDAIYLRMEKSRLQFASGREFHFQMLEDQSRVLLKNTGPLARQVTLRCFRTGSMISGQRLLAPGESWAVEASAPRSGSQ